MHLTSLPMSYSAQLIHFIRCTVLRAVPRALWWVMGVAAFCVLNLAAADEVWPNTPEAELIFTGGLCAALATLPWFAADIARRVSYAVAAWWWRGMWLLIALGCYVGAAASAFIGCIVVAGMCWEMVARIFR